MKIFIILLIFSFSLTAHSSLSDRSLKVLTLNTWLLQSRFFNINIAKDINERLEAMPQLIIDSKAEVIFLQEVWKKKYIRNLSLKLSKKGYFFCHKDMSTLGAMSNGLLIISKFKFIKRCDAFRFSEHTRIDERLVKKGALYGVIEHPSLGKINLFNTHLGAVSFNKASNSYDPIHVAIRDRQAVELVQFIRRNFSQEELIIFGGDLNAHDHQRSSRTDGRDPFDYTRFTHTYKLITRSLDLVDSYRDIHFDTSAQGLYDGFTYNKKNIYFHKDSAQERIDYIFFSNNGILKTENSEVSFKNTFVNARKRLNLSDHYGVMSVFYY